MTKSDAKNFHWRHFRYTKSGSFAGFGDHSKAGASWTLAEKYRLSVLLEILQMGLAWWTATFPGRDHCNQAVSLPPLWNGLLLHERLDEEQRANDLEMIGFHCLDRWEGIEQATTRLVQHYATFSGILR